MTLRSIRATSIEDDDTMALAEHVAPAPDRRNPKAVEAAIRALAAEFGNRLVTSLAVREQHANTTTWIANQPPDAVVFAHTTEDVQKIVRICASGRVPVICYGTGTSLEGHINAPYGGITIDLSEMKRVVAVHAEDLDCVVEPGITRKELNEYLRDQGLFFPIDPSADGYDLTRLFIGSEGTLGVITEITLKLHGIPEAISSGVCPFPTVEAACNATIMAIQAGIPVARIELLDELMVKGCNAYSKLTLPEVPMLFVEFHGSTAGVAEQSERFGEIAAELGGGPFEWATKTEDRTRLWQARHDAYWAGRALRPNAKAFATDVCVPISRLAECVVATQRDIAASGLITPIAGHVGDGNFHCMPMIDMDDPAEMAAVESFMERLVERALAMEGTCTGEHGVGQGKMKYLEAEHGAVALEAMRAVKRALDPDDIMNPGKIVAI